MYSIAMVSRLTGLNASTIRTWERRYNLLEVDREANGRRSYTDSQVERLRQLGRLVAQGHAISDLARMPLSALESVTLPAAAPRVQTASPYFEKLLEAFLRQDFGAFRRGLGEALVFLEPLEAVEQVISPMLGEIGRLWAVGQTTVFAEHLATAITKQLVLMAAGSRRNSQSSLRAIFTTLDGDGHEMGSLLAWYLALNVGVDAIFLGPSLPTDEILLGAETLSADVIMLSLVRRDDDNRDVRQIEALRRKLSRGEIWLGAAPDHPVHELSDRTGVETFVSYTDFASSLSAATRR